MEKTSTSMAGKLKEPKVITDFKQRVVCTLPVGFYFSDERWKKIWQRFEEKGCMLEMSDLKTLFPDEETVQNPSIIRGKFQHQESPTS